MRRFGLAGSFSRVSVSPAMGWTRRAKCGPNRSMSTEAPRKLAGIPEIPADQRTPAVVRLLECHWQQEQIQAPAR